jgi:MSHA pilin protein MshD
MFKDSKLEKKWKARMKTGITLIELVICMVILSIALVVLVKVFADALSGSVASELQTTAVTLGTGLLEEVYSKRFDENFSANDGFSDVLGPDVGEDASDKSSFDDVDDFHGWFEIPEGYAAYQLSAVIYYVNEGEWDTSVDDPTSFKKIEVTVTHPDIHNPVKVMSLVTGE